MKRQTINKYVPYYLPAIQLGVLITDFTLIFCDRVFTRPLSYEVLGPFCDYFQDDANISLCMCV